MAIRKPGRIKKIVRQIFRPRRWLRNAFLFLWHADGAANKWRLLTYSFSALAGKLGLRWKSKDAWFLRLNGVNVNFSPVLSDIIIYKEIFVYQVYQRLPDFQPRGDQVVFDIGANIGLYSIQASRSLGKHGKVFSFEPNPEACSNLNRNIKSNSLGNVEVFPLALGAEAGRAGMDVSVRTGLGTISDDPGKGCGGVNSSMITVEMSTLDDMIGKLGLSRIDLIKMDVEGFEVEVIKGGKRALGITHRMVLEYHGDDLLHQVRKILTGRGFEERLEYRGHAYFENRSVKFGT